MITTAPSQDTIVIGRLLTELLTRMDGLLDTGTSAVLAGVIPDPRAFMNERCEVLRSLVVVLRALLPTAPPNGDATSFDRLFASVEQFRAGLLDLATPSQSDRVGSAPVDDLRKAVSEITTTAAAIAKHTGVVLTCSPERPAYRERIFANLFSWFARA
jgi:hypothetical protein